MHRRNVLSDGYHLDCSFVTDSKRAWEEARDRHHGIEIATGNREWPHECAG